MEIVINNRARGPYTIQIDSWHMAIIASVLSLLIITVGIMAYLLERNDIVAVGVNAGVINAWQKRLERQEQMIAHTRQQAGAQLEILTKRVAELQAQLYMLEGLGTRLAEVAEVDTKKVMDELRAASPTIIEQSELDQEIGPVMPTDFMLTLDHLSEQLSSHAEQLSILEKLLIKQQLSDTILGIGRIVDKGWISSSFGYRTDPFTKRKTWHSGLDISAPQGTPIKAIAAGIVRFAGRRSGYGNLVELDHGNGFVTRYAHNRNNLVMIGDIVTKGQAVAQMGSTGRSTGSHVHFEILKNGEHLNPLSYIQAAG